MSVYQMTNKHIKRWQSIRWQTNTIKNDCKRLPGTLQTNPVGCRWTNAFFPDKVW